MGNEETNEPTKRRNRKYLAGYKNIGERSELSRGSGATPGNRRRRTPPFNKAVGGPSPHAKKEA